jgi:hypothetical protein
VARHPSPQTRDEEVALTQTCSFVKTNKWNALIRCTDFLCSLRSITKSSNMANRSQSVMAAQTAHFVIVMGRAHLSRASQRCRHVRVTTSVAIQLLLHEQRDTMWRQVAGLVSSWVKYSWKLSDTSHDTARSLERAQVRGEVHTRAIIERQLCKANSMPIMMSRMPKCEKNTLFTWPDMGDNAQ